MFIENLTLEDSKWTKTSTSDDLKNVDLVTVFGDTDELANDVHYHALREKYPNANIIGCSSAGNILVNEVVMHSSIVATAINFEKSSVVLKSIDCTDIENVEKASYDLASEFEVDGLRHIFILGDGLKINGSDIIDGFNKALPNISKTGGMAGDGTRVERTYVIANDVAKENIIAAVGFYGESLEISNGSQGGWSSFGTRRVITKSQDNILYELDGEPILDYYTRYLGQYTDDIQSAGFKFPISIKESEDSLELIRTLLYVNDDDKSITFAGDVPQGYIAQLMKPNMDLLIDGAADAAKQAKIENTNTGIGLVVSCTGRRSVMGHIIDEEIKTMNKELGDNVNLVGFYSYGELSPLNTDKNRCYLHNETMTLTTIYEN